MMNRIGRVVREHRNALHMSRQELAEGICCEKYLYMIEKGDRTPSSEMTRLLGDKLGVHLFDYTEYLDCLDPIGMCTAIGQFYRCRRDNDLVSLAKVTEEALAMEDFRNDPWRYEIELNRLMVKMLGEGDFLSAAPALTAIIAEMERKKINTPCLIGLYVILSTCFQMARDIKSAREIVMRAAKAAEGKQRIAKYVQVVSAVKLNKITMHYLAGELDAVIEDTLALIEYENEMSYREYAHHRLFYLAFAYYQSGREDEGIHLFHRALSVMLIRHRATDMYYMASYEIFDVMLNDPRLSKDLRRQFEDEYGVLPRGAQPGK